MGRSGAEDAGGDRLTEGPVQGEKAMQYGGKYGRKA